MAASIEFDRVTNHKQPPSTAVCAASRAGSACIREHAVLTTRSTKHTHLEEDATIAEQVRLVRVLLAVEHHLGSDPAVFFARRRRRAIRPTAHTSSLRRRSGRRPCAALGPRNVLVHPGAGLLCGQQAVVAHHQAQVVEHLARGRGGGRGGGCGGLDDTRGETGQFFLAFSEESRCFDGRRSRPITARATPDDANLCRRSPPHLSSWKQSGRSNQQETPLSKKCWRCRLPLPLAPQVLARRRPVTAPSTDRNGVRFTNAEPRPTIWAVINS